MLHKWKAEAECIKLLSFFSNPRTPVEFPSMKLRLRATPPESNEVENKNIWFELGAVNTPSSGGFIYFSFFFFLWRFSPFLFVFRTNLIDRLTIWFELIAE